MTKPIDLEPAGLFYRPFEYDDWGMIRNADGSMFASVRRPLSEEEAAAHRAAKTDPFEDLAHRLIASFETASRSAPEAGKAVDDFTEVCSPENIRALLDELSRLREVERRAKEVIQPFAIEATEHNGDYRWGWEDDRELAGSQFCDLTFGHFRAARDLYRALSEGQAE